MAEMTVDQAQRCLDAMAKSEANTTAFIDIFGEIASLIDRQQAEIAKKDRMIEIACEMLKAAYETCNNCPIENFCDGVENREIICPGIWAMWLEKEAEVQG